MISGCSLLILNIWQLAQIAALTRIVTIMWLLALRGVALGLIARSTFTTSLGAVPQPLLPRGSALLNNTRYVVQAMSVAVLATVLSCGLAQATKDIQHQAQAALQANSGMAARFGVCETPGSRGISTSRRPSSLAWQPFSVPPSVRP